MHYSLSFSKIICPRLGCFCHEHKITKCASRGTKLVFPLSISSRGDSWYVQMQVQKNFEGRRRKKKKEKKRSRENPVQQVQLRRQVFPRGVYGSCKILHDLLSSLACKTQVMGSEGFGAHIVPDRILLQETWTAYELS
ncbi:hypothetical protein CEXT_608901 [Caerostris extrusa]|uniref:Uncharacterized protein n=1 Tax=Caerostris extrusa TaxID=172846 RepID=A0AAV4XIQ1_CAEEX|nr:hypothetical protein CEXT_608901 [Caerostris extrusa]